MKKKIEKLKNNIYGDYPSERIEPPNNKQLMDKVNEIIERLNQEEPKEEIEELSNCCGARVHNSKDGVGRCSNCKEMCRVEGETKAEEKTMTVCKECGRIPYRELLDELCQECYVKTEVTISEQSGDNDWQNGYEDGYNDGYGQALDNKDIEDSDQPKERVSTDCTDPLVNNTEEGKEGGQFTEDELALLLTGLKVYYKKMDKERMDKDTNNMKFTLWTEEMERVNSLFGKLSKLENKEQ